MKCVGKTCCAT